MAVGTLHGPRFGQYGLRRWYDKHLELLPSEVTDFETMMGAGGMTCSRASSRMPYECAAWGSAARETASDSGDGAGPAECTGSEARGFAPFARAAWESVAIWQSAGMGYRH